MCCKNVHLSEVKSKECSLFLFYAFEVLIAIFQQCLNDYYLVMVNFIYVEIYPKIELLNDDFCLFVYEYSKNAIQY